MLFRSDVAIIEVGLGGRLDSTNIIDPELSIITNISKDHVQFLGDTLELIAKEKAGIVKPGVPVVIGEKINSEVEKVFLERAKECNSEVLFAEELYNDVYAEYSEQNTVYNTKNYPNLVSDLGGIYHINNIKTILTSVDKLKMLGFTIDNKSIYEGISNVTSLTGLQGRWQRLSNNPVTYCDTGHNTGGIEYISKKLNNIKCDKLHIIIGLVNDKDISHILALLPKKATYYFTKASVERGLPAEELKNTASKFNLNGETVKDVHSAYENALEKSEPNDFIFIGGSNFIVGDLLKYLYHKV